MPLLARCESLTIISEMSTKSPKALKISYLHSSGDKPHGSVSSAPNEEELHSSLRHRLTQLREENSQLVTQSHRLISELEDTSHTLLTANSKVDNLQEQLVHEKSDPARERVVLLEAQVKAMQDRLSKNASVESQLGHVVSQQTREKEEWKFKQKSLQDQLCDVQEECRRLRESCSLAEDRAASEKELSTHRLSYLNRTFSSQSLNSSGLLRPIPPKYHSSPLKTHPNPAPHSTLMNHSLTASTSSLSSVKSTQSAKDILSGYSRLKPPFTSSRQFSTPRIGQISVKQNGRELERANARTRHLEKEVTFLEKQLVDKTKSAQSHVEELTQLRTDLAQERASHAMLRQENKQRAASELVRVKALHVDQCHELQVQLERLRGEKEGTGKELEHLRAALKASHSEAASLSGRVSSLLRQLEQERTSHSDAMRSLQREVKGGSARVTELERVLEACRQELEGHVTQVGEAAKLHKSEVEQLRKQVSSLSQDLAQAHHQLSASTANVSRLEGELGEAWTKLQRGQESWREREAKLTQSLQQSEVIRQSLLHQLERSSRDLASYSSKLAEYQQVALEAKHSRVELVHLQRMVGELQQCKEELEIERRTRREEKQSLMMEVGQQRSQLEVVSRRMEESQGRHREQQEARGEAEREVSRVREELQRVNAQLESARSELADVEARSREREGEVEGSLTHMQQELTKRAQQVMEMEGLLRSHQADTTARRLQLERTLSQRQADLRCRTQQLEEVNVKYSQAHKTMEVLRKQVSQLQAAGMSMSTEKQNQLQDKETKLMSLQQRLEEVESVGVSRGHDLERARRELSDAQQREKELRGGCEELGARAQQLERESDAMQEKHLNQMQRLQESHTALLATREQQATVHRLQLQQLMEQERMRQEEVSRCRAQVASLSAELAAERVVAEEGRQQMALVKAEAARYQAQVSSFQRAVSLNNMANMSLPHATSLSRSTPLLGNSTTSSHKSSPHVTINIPSHVAIKTTNENAVAMETTMSTDLESEVEFAQLPVKMSMTSLTRPPTKPLVSNGTTTATPGHRKGEIMHI